MLGISLNTPRCCVFDAAARSHQPHRSCRRQVPGRISPRLQSRQRERPPAAQGAPHGFGLLQARHAPHGLSKRHPRRHRLHRPGIALEVFDGRDGSQLLYAAQVAMSTLKAKGAKKK